MKKLLLVLLLLKQVFAAAENNRAFVANDCNEVFSLAKLQKIELENQTDAPINIDLISMKGKFLSEEENSTVSASSEFVLYNPESGQPLTSLRVKNVQKKPAICMIPQKKAIYILPREIQEFTVQFPSIIAGLSAQQGNILPEFTGEYNDEKIKVKFGTESSIKHETHVGIGDLSLQLSLYKEYFMNDSDYTQEQILQDFLSQPPGVTETKRPEEVIVTLTSYPARFQTTWLAIESLLRQTERPDRVNLNLFEEEFPGRVLPWFIRQQMKRGLEINWCPENLKVYLKVIPAIQKFPEAAVVAFDDDVVYPNNRLFNLVNEHRAHPDHIIAQEVREMTNYGGYIYPCCEWNFTGWNGFVDDRKLGPSNLLVPEGVTGVLFPRRCLHETAYNYNMFRELTPTEDDLWLYAALILNKRQVVKIPSDSLPRVIFDAHNMDSALSKINTANGYAVSAQCFFNLFHSLNLESLLSIKGFSKYSQEVREHNYQILAYGEFVTPRNPRSPISLINGFSWTENWVGHRGGVWTNDHFASFSVTVPQKGFAKISLKSRFLKHPSHDFVKFRIKRDGYTMLRGEFDSEWFDFTLVDSFDSYIQKYELSIDNPINASTCGFRDNRNLGILIYKVNVESLNCLCFDNKHYPAATSAIAEICDIDERKQLLREGASNIAFSYALHQCGINETELKDRFSNLISNCYQNSIARNIMQFCSIPFLHHRAWHTPTTKSCEVPDHILNKYISSLKEMRRANDSWRNIFWCNGKNLIPSTVSRLLSECPWIDIREVNDFPGVFVGKKFYELLINDGRFTNANDVFRMSLIHEMGGVYFDLGFEVIRDISSWLQTYDYIVAMYPSGAVDHHVLGMAPFNKFTEAYLRRLHNPSSIVKTLISEWSSCTYFQQHLFFGASGFLVDLLERATVDDKILFVPENNPFIRRHNMGSWFIGNSFGNTPVEHSAVDLFKL